MRKRGLNRFPCGHSIHGAIVIAGIVRMQIDRADAVCGFGGTVEIECLRCWGQGGDLAASCERCAVILPQAQESIETGVQWRRGGPH